MFRRSRAREVALQVLYQDDLNPRVNPHDAEDFIARRLKDKELIEFASALVAGVRAHRAQLDAQVEQFAQNWRLQRMAATDRNVLRLGAYEILYGGTPDRVAVNEAPELSKRFGSAQSSQFVNGILDRFVQHAAGVKDKPLPRALPAEASLDVSPNEDSANKATAPQYADAGENSVTKADDDARRAEGAQGEVD